MRITSRMSQAFVRLKILFISNIILRYMYLIYVSGPIILLFQCVLVGESRTLRRLFKKSGTSSNLLANHMLVFNLALADSLMGLYLIILGAAGVIYSGAYCANKLEWLSGPTCSALGALVVASSETSVITMVLLTSFRLYAVFWVSNCFSAKVISIVHHLKLFYIMQATGVYRKVIFKAKMLFNALAGWMACGLRVESKVWVSVSGHSKWKKCCQRLTRVATSLHKKSVAQK